LELAFSTSRHFAGLQNWVVTPLDMLAELRDDNKQMAASMREMYSLCDEYEDVATASLLETWINETERRTWFLFEATRRDER
jgi:starvation-inducible DNA-binding protein